MLMVYMDDIVVYSQTAEEHLEILAGVLGKLAQAGLKINPAKTTLVSREVSYLGHVVSAKGIKPNPAKVTAVLNLDKPTNVKEVRMFLGLTGYYRRFIPAFAAHAEPLNALTRKHEEFRWGEAEQAAFEYLKTKLCEAPVLAYPLPQRQNIIDCDASEEAAGAVLMQETEDGEEVVIQYASYTFSETERRWPAMEREAFAVIWALTTFRTYVLGRHCIVRTDNSAAARLSTAKQAKLQRWGLVLAEYEVELRYRPGKRQSHVDALSRLPVKKPRATAPNDIELPERATAFSAIRATHSSLQQLDWATARARDPDFRALFKYLQASGADKPKPKPPAWFAGLQHQVQARFITFKDDIMFRGMPPKDRSRWLVPRDLRQAIIAAHHRGTHGAHMGVAKTAARIAMTMYWPKMHEHVKQFIRVCDRCQRVKAAPKIPTIARMLNREALWATVACDFFGPLHTTRKQNVYVLVGIDHFSRWPELLATRKANAAVVADFIHARIIAQHGTPKELLTDHGSHFASRVISTLCKKYGIRRLMSTPYTPQSNGIVERFMGYLKGALATLVDENPTSWDDHLPAVAFAYRATPHPDVGDTPFFINKGYDPIIPELRAVDAPGALDDHRGTWLDRLEAARNKLERQVAAQQEIIRQKIENAAEGPFQPGQLVLVKRTPHELRQDPEQSKLSDKYDRIGRITKAMTNKVAFEVKFLTGGEDVINQRNLRPFYEPAEGEDELPALQRARFPVATLHQDRGTDG